jgi:hypothetical protein
MLLTVMKIQKQKIKDLIHIKMDVTERNEGPLNAEKECVSSYADPLNVHSHDLREMSGKKSEL